MKKNDLEPQSIDAYLANLPVDQREALERLRGQIHAFVPEVKEKISYKVPVFIHYGSLVGFAAFKEHLSFFVMSTSLVAKLSSSLADFKHKGATIHFSPEKPIPKEILHVILKERINENQKMKM